MRIVVALGGNALLKRNEPLTAEAQRGNVRTAARIIGALAEFHDVIVTHGNGPQVGLLALQAAAYEGSGAWPLDVLGAESEGMIGYAIEQALIPMLPGRRLATLLTQVAVDPLDPAFSAPSKPVGPRYSKAEAESLARERGWSMGEEGHSKVEGGDTDKPRWRRVVPSPHPRHILEIATIRHLVADGTIVICAGGGGIPVFEKPEGTIIGVEAVIDKDWTASRLARDVGADALILLTDVDAVYEDWDGPQPRRIDEACPKDMETLSFEAGSMGPKVAAACAFVSETGGFAGIGRLEDAVEILAGRVGTRIRPCPV